MVKIDIEKQCQEDNIWKSRQEDEMWQKHKEEQQCWDMYESSSEELYIAPIGKRAKLRECQKGVTDEREKTMDWSGKAVNRTARAEGRMFRQRFVQ